MALIAIISGGALTAILNVFLERGKQKRAAQEKNIDARIATWQTLADKNEGRLQQLEKRLEIYGNDLKSLERYVLILEQMLIKADPTISLPERPNLKMGHM
ncbi:MAG: hypothetical protein FWF44_04585 [Defluviitaleaceae bacterium]|nr:hypothetical protein [Defluviitaleaceae bacterium]